MTCGEAVAKRILDLCSQHKITPNKLGTISGVTQSTINNIINTGSKNPTILTIKKLCDGLNIKLYDFFDDELFDTLDQVIS